MGSTARVGNDLEQGLADGEGAYPGFARSWEPANLLVRSMHSRPAWKLARCCTVRPTARSASWQMIDQRPPAISLSPTREFKERRTSAASLHPGASLSTDTDLTFSECRVVDVTVRATAVECFLPHQFVERRILFQAFDKIRVRDEQAPEGHQIRTAA